MNAILRLFTRAEFLLLIVVLIWGLNFIVMKGVINVIEPFAFNAVRLSLAALFLLVFGVVRDGWPKLSRVDLLKLMGLGIVGSTFYHALMISGLNLGTPENTALFVATSPIWTTVFVTLIRWEKIRPIGWLGVGLSFVGAAIVIMTSVEQPNSGASNILLGAVLTLCSAACWGLYTVFSKDLLARHSPLHTTSIALAFGVLFLWPFSISQVIAAPWASFSLLTWLGLLYTGLLSIAFCYVIWAYGVRQIGASPTAVYVNLVPVVTFIGAFLLLNKPFFLLQVIGGVVVIMGIYLTNRARVKIPAPGYRLH